MNAYSTKKEGFRIYQGGRKEQVRKRYSGKECDRGSEGGAGSIYGQLVREFMGTCVDSRGMKLFSVENLL